MECFFFVLGVLRPGFLLHSSLDVLGLFMPGSSNHVYVVEDHSWRSGVCVSLSIQNA
jgi:hypothetical protein